MPDEIADTSDPQARNKMVPLVQQNLELLAKSWVPIIAAIYGSGYVIVSVYHASLGLNAIDVRSPRILASGLLFFLLLSIAVYTLHYCRPIVSEMTAGLSAPRRYLANCSFAPLLVFTLDCGAIGAISRLLHFEGPQPHSKIFVALISLSAAFLLIVLFCRQTQRFPRWIFHWITLLCCGLTLGVLLLISIPYDHQFGIRQGGYYLFSVQFLLVSISISLGAEALRKTENWFLLGVQGLLPLLFYCVTFYPHVRGAFGGGESTAAKIFLTTAIGSDNVKTFPAVIIDETDNGFYLIESGHTEVRFVPRTQISSIEFARPSSLFTEQ
jgi:hypothetical protein